MLHSNLRDKWFKMTLPEQMGNIGSEVGRVAKSFNKNEERFWGAVERALELFNLTISDPRWGTRTSEIGRAREIFSDAVLGSKEYKSFFPEIEKYFNQFAFLARAHL